MSAEVGPRYSILMPVHEPDVAHLRAAVASVLEQTSDDWELIAVLDGPQRPEVCHELDRVRDDRVVVIQRADNGGIGAASTDALDRARGDFIALLDQDDLLAPFALEANSREIDTWPDVDVLYSDEDKVAADGRRDEPFCKPGWSPERLRCHMYLGHLGVYRRTHVLSIGGFRSGFDGAQDHDLALRATESARRIVHIPRVLYHWRRSAGSTAEDPEAKSWAFDAGVRAVQSHIDRIGMQATAYRDPGAVTIRVRPALVRTPLVSVIIPTAMGTRAINGERICLVNRTLESIAAKTTYAEYEIVVVGDRTVEEERLGTLTAHDPGRIRTVRNDRPFNFAEACNLGRDNARGEVLIFLNDDCEVVSDEWLARMVMFTSLDGVGAVGARLLYPDGRLQHGGLVARHGGINHRHHGEEGSHPSGFNQLTVTSNLVAVTGACLGVRADRFDSIGGFAARFPLAFNDVDLCFKLLYAGFRTVFDPEICLVHYESSSRDPAVTKQEIEDLEERWYGLLRDDPYDNPVQRTYGYQQVQPPAVLIELRERLGEADEHGRPWPLW